MKFFRSRFGKVLTIKILVALATQMFAPAVSYALTGGPTQPEVQQFQAAGTTGLVDPFTGDFSYNIPLFNLPGPDGGYPFNLAYQSGVSMDQEASWVGLGWSLNPGAITRQTRGLPDDFDGDKVRIERRMRATHNFGLRLKKELLVGGEEIWGVEVPKGLIDGELTIYGNTERGLGYSIAASARVDALAAGPYKGSLSLGLSLDSQEGYSASPGLGLRHGNDDNKKNYSLGASMNSRNGLQGVTLGASYQKRMWNKQRSGGYSGSVSVSVSLFSPYNYTTPTSIATETRALDMEVKLGTSIALLYRNRPIPAFYDITYLSPKAKDHEHKAYGYLNLDQGSKFDLKDYSREKDGMIHDKMTHLSSPVLTNDLFQVSGQGIGGTFRAYRSDIGVVGDQELESRVFSAQAGADISMNGGHYGADFSGSRVKSQTTIWSNENNVDYRFSKSHSANPYYEKAYFKFLGEHTVDALNELDYIENDKPVRIKIGKKGTAFSREVKAENEYQHESYDPNTNTYFKNEGITRLNTTESREPRNNVPQALPNKYLKQNARVLSSTFYKYNTIDNNGNTTSEQQLPDYDDDHKIGAFQMTQTNGKRYIYGIAAENTKDVECSFSVDKQESVFQKKLSFTKSERNNESHLPKYHITGTKKYLERKTINSDYAHSFLLTSVLGNDYIDADYDENDNDTWGPSDGDLGYWVKFNYKKHEGYNWRAPYRGANYLPGDHLTPVDDMGAYNYGERDNWYIQSAETKSHIALFHISPRKDAKGAAGEIDGNNELDPTNPEFGASSFKLDKIELFIKKELKDKGDAAVPLQTVHFDYSYDLCGNVPNNEGGNADWIDFNNDGTADYHRNENRGKLTLKKVWVTYGTNQRGAKTPYVFDYHERAANGWLIGSNPENPDYNDEAYDRWGNFAKFDSQEESAEYPYTKQFDHANADFNDEVAQRAGAWSLKEIQLPSGGRLKVDYERDDYGYVQTKPAMQMQPIVATTSSQGDYGRLDHNDCRVYFELEQPIAVGTSQAEWKRILNRYFDHTGEVALKVKVAMLGMDDEDDTPNAPDYLDVYADIAKDGNEYDHGLGQSVDGFYRTAWVRLDKWDERGTGYHPVAVAAWQYLRTNHPQALNLGDGAADQVGEDASEADKKAKVMSLFNVWGELLPIFMGWYNHLDGKGFGVYIHLNKSYIRLNSPDRKKIGGGSRVRQITYYDNWDQMTNDAEDASFYGQVYSYTTEEDIDKDGVLETISSGVATNEPSIGKEENALRYSVRTRVNRPLATDDNHTIVGPVNENMMPGASVGYSKVRIESIASHYAGKEDLNYSIPEGVLTTGALEQEFYTARDFPVLFGETPIHIDHPRPLTLPVPVVGLRSRDVLGATQGYSLVLNDMHGKQKKTSYFRDDISGNLQEEAYSTVEHFYASDEKYDRESGVYYSVLKNDCEVLIDMVDESVINPDGSYSSKTDIKTIGVDAEMVVDMREHFTKTTGFGVEANLDIIPTVPPMFFPSGVPDFGPRTTKLIRTAVTNKIVSKLGILERVVATNEGSRIETENVLFDKVTGAPLVTKVNNQYEDKYVYSYSLPAHQKYDGMGEAYKNQGSFFLARIRQLPNDAGLYGVRTFIDPRVPNQTMTPDLVPGDEYIVGGTSGIYMGKNPSGEALFDFPDYDAISYNAYDIARFDCIRSGRRNQLGASYQNFTSLNSPNSARYQEVQNEQLDIPVYTTIHQINPNVHLRAQELLDLIVNARVQLNLLNSTGAYDFNIANLNAPLFESDDPSYDYFEVFGEAEAFECSENSEFSNLHRLGCVLFRKPKTVNNWLTQTEWIIAFPHSGSHLSPIEYGSDNTQRSMGWEAARSSNSHNNYFSINESVFDVVDVEHFVSIESTTPCENYIVVMNSGSEKLIRSPQVCGACIVDVQVPTLGDISLNNDFYNHPNILNISANTFSDNWLLSPDEYAKINSTNPYLNGSQGIWRSEASFAYKKDRRSSTDLANNQEPDLDVDGTFTASIFDPANPFMSDADPAWVEASTVTQHNANGYGVESRDAIGNHSAALYGYDGHMVVAVANNAKASEIAYEGFEFESGRLPESGEVNEGNFNLFNTPTLAGTASGIKFDVLAGNGNLMIVDAPLAAIAEPYPEVRVSGRFLTDQTLAGINGTYAVTNVVPHPNDVNKCLVELDPTAFEQTGIWSGQLQIEKLHGFTYNESLSLSKAKVHSGQYSLKLENDYTQVQSSLQLVPEKKYHFSTWVALDGFDNKDMNYGDLNDAPKVSLFFHDEDGASTGATEMAWQGRSINGWQQLKGDFVVPANTASVSLKLEKSDNYTTYLDDMRLQPFNSSMMTYAYDWENMRLSAQMDDNNFTTYYYYDSEGQLYQTKQETARGVMSLQDVLSHKAEK